MKKFMTMLLTAVFVLMPCSAVAKSGTVVGKVYSTDILADVNGRPVTSYNIGGKTVIVAEDLEDFGFEVSYDDSARRLSIVNCGAMLSGSGEEVERNTSASCGKVVGNVYETDITVTVNDLPITGYNIGGKTALCIEDLGKVAEGEPNYAYGYSKYLCNAVWDPKARTISLNNYESNNGSYLRNSFWAHSLTFDFEGGVLTANYDIMNTYDSHVRNVTISNADKKDAFILKPLYILVNGKKTEIGSYYVCRHIDGNYTYISFYDDQVFDKALVGSKPKAMTYAEVENYLKGVTDYTVTKRAENDTYTVWSMCPTAEDRINDYIMVSNKKKGGLICLGNILDHSISYTLKENVLTVNVDNWAGPHGSTTMVCEYDLTWYDFEN